MGIKNCEWLDAQPAFLAEVKVDGKVIATIHALTKLDMAEIRRKSDTKAEVDGKGSVYLITSPEKLEVSRMFQSLTGHPKVGWEFDDRKITEANINVLPKVFFDAITNKIAELEKQNEITEGQEKN